MILQIALIVFGVYVYVAWLLARALHRATGRRWLQMTALAVLIFAPLYDLIIGYFVFEKFAREHPGVPVTQIHTVESVLVSGRKVPIPEEGLWGWLLLLPEYEYRREDVLEMVPPMKEPLRAYVQFREVDPDDPTCFQRYRDAINPGPGRGCVGVTTTDKRVSRYEVFRDPDGSKVLRVQLNSSSMFPIYGAHSYVRDLSNGQMVAETWHMAYYVWWANTPEMMVFSRQTPGGRNSLQSLVAPADVTR